LHIRAEVGDGQSLNPHDLKRSPAGSSGGTGVAIAAAYAPLGCRIGELEALDVIFVDASACPLNESLRCDRAPARRLRRPFHLIGLPQWLTPTLSSGDLRAEWLEETLYELQDPVGLRRGRRHLCGSR
jgi:hypothetical protein